MLGIDIIDIERFKKVALRTPSLLGRVFTPAELAYCQKKKDPYPSLAARFAAKEAVRKLDYNMIKGIKYQDIEVIVEDSGKPKIRLHGKALEQSVAFDTQTIAISLSHSQQQAVAIAGLMKG